MIHAMIDLETLSTNPNATILTVGGVKFDPYTNVEPAQGMYFRVDVDSQTEMGRDVMQDTLDWWGRQDPEIMEEALGDKDRISLDAMVKTINKWCVGVDVFWCQGPPSNNPCSDPWGQEFFGQTPLVSVNDEGKPREKRKIRLECQHSTISQLLQRGISILVLPSLTI
mgnify:CR=1 FL=1